MTTRDDENALAAEDQRLLDAWNAQTPMAADPDFTGDVARGRAAERSGQRHPDPAPSRGLREGLDAFGSRVHDGPDRLDLERETDFERDAPATATPRGLARHAALAAWIEDGTVAGHPADVGEPTYRQRQQF